MDEMEYIVISDGDDLPTEASSSEVKCDSLTPMFIKPYIK